MQNCYGTFRCNFHSCKGNLFLYYKLINTNNDGERWWICNWELTPDTDWLYSSLLLLLFSTSSVCDAKCICQHLLNRQLKRLGSLKIVFLIHLSFLNKTTSSLRESLAFQSPWHPLSFWVFKGEVWKFVITSLTKWNCINIGCFQTKKTILKPPSISHWLNKLIAPPQTHGHLVKHILYYTLLQNYFNWQKLF